MSSILPVSSIEVFIPFSNEASISECRAEYLSVSNRPKGSLIITNYRIAFLEKHVGSIYRKTGEMPLYSVGVNIGYEGFISASLRREKGILPFKPKEYIEIAYEDIRSGISRKALFYIRDKVVKGKDLVETMKLASAKFRSQEREPLLPIREFMKYVEYLSLDKAIRPLYFDTVSRCIAIGSSYFCIKGLEWSIEGSPDIVNKAKAWIDEYLSHRGMKSG